MPDCADDQPAFVGPGCPRQCPDRHRHLLSHFYVLCLPPMFLSWQKAFDVSFAELGLSVALMSATTAILQTPVGFLVDRHGARRVPGRRHPPDGPVDVRHGDGHGLLANPGAGAAVRHGQFGDPSGRLRDPRRLGESPADGPVVRAPYLQRQCRLVPGAADHRAPDRAHRLARHLADGRAVRRSGRAPDPVAEPDPAGPGAAAAARRHLGLRRQRAADDPADPACSSASSC